MKVATPLILLAAVAYAQQDLSGIPPCGRKCVENMFNKAKELGCSDDDFDCLCENADFGNGLHDCTVEACPQGQLQAVEEAAAKMCPNGAPGDGSSSTGGSEEPTPSLTDSVIPSDSATGTGAEPTGTGAEPTATDGDGGQTGGAGASTPYTTKPVVSTVTSDGETQETTVGSTTLFTKVAGGTGTGSGTATGTGAEPTETGGNGNGGGGDNETGGNGNGGNETGGNGSGSGPTGTEGGGDATGTDSGSSPTDTGAAAALNIHTGSMAGAIGLAALLVM